MKTTLNIDNTIMKRIKEEAAANGRTMSELIEMALRQFLDKPRAVPDLPDLPGFDGGGSLVEVADREALYTAMEGR